MDENHRDEIGNKTIVAEDVRWVLNKRSMLWVPQHKKQGKASNGWVGFFGRTLWDWLNLLGVLAIPFVVTVIGLYFTQQITQQQAQLSERQHQTDLQIAADQQRETTLLTCIDNIRDLLLNKGLKTSKPDDEVRVVTRAEVLSTLRQLDGARKGLLMRFLSEAGLVTNINRGNDVIIDLSGANLADANLSSTNLIVVNQEDVWYINEPLGSVDLSGAHLTFADLSGAQLFGAQLFGAQLVGAHLNNADLTFADLSGAHLNDAHLNNAHLLGAQLVGADLSDSDLRGVDLRGANLRGVDLRGANLRGANLRGAKVTEAQLAEATSIQGATMPDGSKHP